MKNVIAISAGLKYCSIAVSYENEVYEANEDIDAASNLVWLADNLLKSNHINLEKINGVIAAAGPGSFTGIRVAQSFAKGLALSLELSAASMNYFDIINAMERDFSDAVIVIKSEKNQIYYRIGEKTGISPPELLADKIDNGVVLVGDAVAEVALHAKSKIIDAIYVDDFRKAKYLLGFSHLITPESQIRPFYISHS